MEENKFLASYWEIKQEWWGGRKKCTQINVIRMKELG
jgi:hypothetical protein